MTGPPLWMVCARGICLYETTARARCVAHQAALAPAPTLNGLSRTKARRKLEETDERSPL